MSNCANHKTVNAAVFDLLDTDTLDAPTLAALTAVAAQCPLRGGDAVYEARNIVLRRTGLAFDDEAQCAGMGERRRAEQTPGQFEEIRLYPNPSAHEVFWVGLGDTEVRAQVYDALGRQLVERRPNGNWIDVSSLPAGIYWLRLTTPEGRCLATKTFQVEK